MHNCIISVKILKILRTRNTKTTLIIRERRKGGKTGTNLGFDTYLLYK